MVPDYSITIIVSIVEIMVIFWGLSQLQRELRAEVEELETSIDEKLALAIQSTGLVAGGEPINPVQQAIANMISNMATNRQAPAKTIVLQDEKGLFTKKD